MSDKTHEEMLQEIIEYTEWDEHNYPVHDMGIMERNGAFLVDSQSGTYPKVLFVRDIIRDIEVRKKVFGEEDYGKDHSYETEWVDDLETLGIEIDDPTHATYVVQSRRFHSMKMSIMETREEQLEYMYSFLQSKKINES